MVLCAVKVRCRAGVFLYLSGSGSLVDGTKLECKVISVEEVQPVGMFPSGCLKWINLSNTVSWLRTLCPHKQTCVQTKFAVAPCDIFMH